ncbi:MAG: O-antigen translocase [Pseudomonadota bacterium]
MSLVRTSLLNGIAVVVKIGSALVLNKVLAIYVGPAGYAMIGQFQNVVSIVVSLAGGVMGTGVTKATAEHFDDETAQHRVWRTAVKFSILASLLSGAALLLFANRLALWLLDDASMSSIFVWLAVTLPAMAANNMLMAILNGKKEVGIYVMANIFGSVVSLVVTGILAFTAGLYGALVAFTINPALVLLSTAAVVARRDWFRPRFLWGEINRSALRGLAGFGLMGLTSGLAVPFSFMLIRDNLASHMGLTAAGYWQASWKISEIYLMLITTTLSVYYLPRLAEIKCARELKGEIFKIYRLVLPIVVAGALAIYGLRDLIIRTLFTPEFSPMRDLFGWQLTGDVIKVAAWVLAYVMLGRAMVKMYIASEILFAALLVFLSWVFVKIFGTVGISMAYALNYAIYLVAMALMTRGVLNTMKQVPVSPARIALEDGA